MKADGLQNVRGEPVMVPHWVRGEESAELVNPRRTPLRMLGLGGSVGTPAEGITAPVLVVARFDELQQRAAEAKGKIVLFDVPFTDYVATRKVRTDGPVRGGAGRRGRVPHPLGGVRLDPEPAHRPDALRLDRGEDPRGRAQRRGRRDAAPVPGSRRADRARRSAWAPRPCPTRRRATWWPRSSAGRSRTRSWWWAATSIPGTWGRARWTTAAARWRRGRRCG